MDHHGPVSTVLCYNILVWHIRNNLQLTHHQNSNTTRICHTHRHSYTDRRTYFNPQLIWREEQARQTTTLVRLSRGSITSAIPGTYSALFVTVTRRLSRLEFLAANVQFIRDRVHVRTRDILLQAYDYNYLLRLTLNFSFHNRDIQLTYSNILFHLWILGIR